MSEPAAEKVHATCVVMEGTGVLIRGESGSGKSDLALRLMDGGAELVSDDYSDVSLQGDRLLARAPDGIAGMIEVRGLGVIKVGHRDETTVRLVVELVRREDLDRLPDPETCNDYGAPLMLIRLDPFDASATAKVRLAARLASGHNIRAD